MNKEDFLAELRRQLKVKKEDKESIMDEYKSYFAEAMANGETEEDIIQSLESPEEIAKTCNEELGTVKEFDETIDESVNEFKKEYKKFMDSDFLDKVTSKLDKAMDSLEEKTEHVIKNVNIEESINKMVGAVGKTVSKVMKKVQDIDIDGIINSAVGGVAIKFDNSKVQTIEFSGESLNLIIDDQNALKFTVELVGSEEGIITKTLPTTLPVQPVLDQDNLHIEVPSSGILYSEKKRMKVYIPHSVKRLNVTSNCPLSVIGLETSLELNMDQAPLSLKELEGETFVLHGGNGPVSAKELQFSSSELTMKNGPLSITDVRGEQMHIVVENGPISLKDFFVDNLSVQAGNGPITIKDVLGDILQFQISKGPATIKDIKADELTLMKDGGVLTLKNITVDQLKGDISGTMKSMTDVHADEFDLNE